MGKPEKEFCDFQMQQLPFQLEQKTVCLMVFTSDPFHPRKVMLAVHRAACTAAPPPAGHALAKRRERLVLLTRRRQCGDGVSVLRLYGFSVH